MKRIISMVVILCMSITSINTGILYAQTESADNFQIIEEVQSSETFTEEYYIARTPLDEKYAIYVEGKSKTKIELFGLRLLKCGDDSKYVMNAFVKPNSNGEFSIKINTEAGNKTVPEVIDEKGTVIQADQCYDTRPGYKAVEPLEKGFYRLGITKAFSEEDADLSQGAEWWSGPLGGGNSFYWKGAVFWCNGEDNDLKLVKFTDILDGTDVIRENVDGIDDEMTDSYIGSYTRYVDKDLNDISYTLKDYDTGEKQDALTAAQIRFISDLADDITAGDDTDYEKIKSIYEYLAKSFYYDRYGLVHPKEQYVNPYANLYCMINHIDTPNSREGKYATVCDGFVAMAIALARTENIPCRMVQGIYSPSNAFLWSSIDASMSSNHWWMEAYIDGEWKSFDVTNGCDGSWSRTNRDDYGEWTRDGAVCYAGFDFSDESASTLYKLKKIGEGSNKINFICYKNELEQLKAFLNETADGKSNGSILNPDYDENEIETWGPPDEKQLTSNGYGRIYQILLGDRNLYGKLNLKGFSAVKDVSVFTNDLSQIDLRECYGLKYFNAVGNNLSYFDSSDSPQLTDLSVKANPLTKATFCCNDDVITIESEGGTFAFNYKAAQTPPLTIYVGSADENMVYDGVFDGHGNRLSTEKTFAFVPSDTTYKVKFRDNSAERLAAPAVKVENKEWSGNIYLSWKAVAGADQYIIYRATKEDGSYQKYVTTKNTYLENKADTGSVYYYKVKAADSTNPDITSAYGNIVKGMQKLGRTSLSSKIDAASGKIVLSWDAVDDANRYNIYRSISQNSGFELLDYTDKTTYTDKTAKAETKYYYKVKAACQGNSAVTSMYSNVASRTCDLARPSVTASNVASTGKIKVTWKAVSGADKYYVYRAGSKTGEYKCVETVTGTSYIDKGASAEYSYYYKVIAASTKTSDANSAYSTIVSRTCDLARPSVTASNVASTGKIKLAWKAVSGADKYYVYRAGSKDGTYKYLGSTTGTSYTNTGASEKYTYYYKVKAVSTRTSNANSAYSTVVSRTCDLARPTAKVALSSSGKPKVTWSSVSGATKYEIWRKAGSSGTYTKYDTVTKTSYTNTSAKTGTTYYYKIKAICGSNSSANSAFSNVVYQRAK